MKDFKIQYNGKEETITINDDPDTDTILKIAEYGMDWTSLPVKIKPRELPIIVACNLIVKAPWGDISPSTIRKLPGKTFVSVMNAIAETFTIEDFLSPVAKLLSEKQSEKQALRPETDSITFSHSGV